MPTLKNHWLRAWIEIFSLPSSRGTQAPYHQHSSPPYSSIDPNHPVSTHCDGRSGLGKRVSGDIGRTLVLRVVMGSEKWGGCHSSFSLNMKAQGRPKPPCH